MKSNLFKITAVLMGIFSSPAHAASIHAWVAYPDGGKVVCGSLSPQGVQGLMVVAKDGAADLPPGLTLGPDSLPSLVWLGETGDIFFSAYNGTNWSPSRVIVPSFGNHRGIPSLAVSGIAVVAWAESGSGGFEDIFYAVRTAEGWSGPRPAHEPNSVPDILPTAFASPEGKFAIVWKSLDGSNYVEKRIGDPAAVPRGSDLPDDLAELAIGAGLPLETAIASLGDDGRARLAYLKQIIDERERRAALMLGLSDTPFPTETPTETPTGASPPLTMTPTETPTGEPTTTAPPVTSTPAETSLPATATPAPRHVYIIAFGDSITYGRGSSTNGPRTGYPVILEGILNYNFAPTRFHLINEGLGGEQTDMGLGRIGGVLDSHHADGILIMEGTNDMFFNISFETVQENLKQMAFRAKSRGVSPILATLIPTVPSLRPAQYQRTRNFYTGGYVQSLSRLYGIPYADQWNAFCSIPYFASVLMDWSTGNHPNDNGYRYVMSPEWYATITPYINPSFRPVGPVLALRESVQAVTRGSIEDFGYSLVPSNDLVRNLVDCYVALRHPDGRLLVFNSSWQLTSAVTPVLRGVVLSNVPRSGSLLELPITTNYSAGAYTLYLVMVRSFRNPLDTGSWTGYADIHFTVQ
ncbi:MAG: SGNH/GDSL hydrolase family protein [Candidatus Aureabacteria bacterium]|nr:SGNH/GDSL hydrolase family protein [Candidatus Auribacterota bacterium]